MKRLMIVLITCSFGITVQQSWNEVVYAAELRFLTVGHTADAQKYLLDHVIPYIENKLGVTVVMDSANWTTRTDKIVVSIAGGVPYDVISTGNSAPWEEGRTGLLAPLNEYVDRWEKRAYFPDPLWEATEWDGITYHIPHVIDIRAVAYNKRLFAESGLDAEHPPDSWDALVRAARRLTRMEGDRVAVSGFNIERGSGNGAAQDLYWFSHQAGIQMVEVDTLSSNLNRSEALDALYVLAELAEVGRYGFPVIGSGGFSQGYAAMQKQSVAISLPNIQRQNPDLLDDYGTFAPQRTPGSAPVAHGFTNGLAILAASRNKDLAWQFIDAFHDDEVRLGFEQATGNLSGRIDLMHRLDESIPKVEMVHSLLSNFQRSVYVAGTGMSTLAALVRQVFDMEIPPETALLEGHQLWERMLTEWENQEAK